MKPATPSLDRSDMVFTVRANQMQKLAKFLPDGVRDTLLNVREKHPLASVNVFRAELGARIAALLRKETGLQFHYNAEDLTFTVTGFENDEEAVLWLLSHL
jgi:hypothetical protein